MRLGLVGVLLLVGGSAMGAPLPEGPLDFVANHCLECHDEDTQKGEINLDVLEVDWTDADELAFWERVLKAVESGEMPPEKKARPDEDARLQFLSWIDAELIEHTNFGGTLARRLNQAEYRATVEALFELKGFELPPGFPVDREHHGFDNLGEGLVLSPPLLESYAQAAALIADAVFPPKRDAAEVIKHQAGAGDLVISYSSGKVVGDALRLGMKCDPIQRSSTWPTRIEAHASGVYRLTVNLSSFQPKPDAGPMKVKVLARDVASADGVTKQSLRLLQEIQVENEAPDAFTFEATLYEGQTPVVHWDNASLDSDRADKAELQTFFREKEKQVPGYLAAWHSMVSGGGQGFRGGIGWERVKRRLAEGNLPELSSSERAGLLKKIGSNPVLYAETVVFDVFENGPALEVHGLEMEGPIRLVDGPRDQERERLQRRFFGDDESPREVIRRFLSAAFRRPVDDETVAAYVQLHDRHRSAGYLAEDSMHLVIRKALISPRFLYRSLREGELDGFDLATRLSYFLTGAPPDESLLKEVRGKDLADPSALRRQALRLLPNRASAPMIVNFTGQWLDTRLLPEIMPDPAFKFLPSDEKSAREEVEHVFFEMLSKNRPMTDFVDPDFTWTSARVAQNIYGLSAGFDKKKSNSVHRVDLLRGGRYGGVLGNAAVMMATANGVDTQPVMRGVWVLENLLGSPPPPPPMAVPALTPDTQGAKNPRELLAAHTTEESCAGCHKRIDPVGFVLENFDPVGRWRETWPGIDQPIESASTLPDGTRIEDVVDLKAWLVENIDLFSNCLAEKLVTFATGRVPNYSERKEIAAIVARNREEGHGFQDLLLALIDSETFRTK